MSSDTNIKRTSSGGLSTGGNLEVVELTDFVDLARWPEGTRLIVRREREAVVELGHP